MRMYPDTELEQMMTDLESDLIERKEGFRGSAPENVREAVCAFANDLPDHRRPGVVFIGVDDKGTPVGLNITDELLLALADIKTDGNITPPPTLTVGKHILKGSDVAIIAVGPADSPPVRFKGRIYIRIGPRRGIASAQDERILNEKRRYRDRPYDIQPVTTATVNELDRVRFTTEYLPALVAPDILSANDRSVEQQLAATKMVYASDQLTPTVLGILVIGKATRSLLAGAYIQFLRIDGTELYNPIVDEQMIDGTVSDMIRRLDEKLAAHNRTRVDFTSGPLEQRYPLFPTVALQQLTRNAILHRRYEGTYAPVRVYWYDDRIEIVSPGGPYGEVTPANFGTPGLTDYRNPNLAEAMRALGYVQRFGGGIVAARNALQGNGNPPLEFRVDQNFVVAVIRPAW